MEKLCKLSRRREKKHSRQGHFDVWNIWVLNLVCRTEGGTYAEGDWEWGSEDDIWA